MIFLHLYVHITITYLGAEDPSRKRGDRNRKHIQAGGKAMLVSAPKRIPEKRRHNEQS